MTIRLQIRDSGGNGSPIILLHGFPLASESFSNQFDALLKSNYRVIAYDRRGFGRSEKPMDGFDYDTLANDLHEIIESLRLKEVNLLGFSMGGGEVARYIRNYGESKIRSLIFASSVTPYMLQTPFNPDGYLTPQVADEKRRLLMENRESYFEGFVSQFFEADGKQTVTEEERLRNIAMCLQSDPLATIGCMDAFMTTDFREDLEMITVPTLVIHGDCDAIVPFEGSGKRTHFAIPHSELALIAGGPHGIHVSHSGEFNDLICEFLQGIPQSPSPSPIVI